MSSGWFGRALASAKDAASKTQGAPGGILGGVLSSVAEAANDRVKRVGQALHARVTGRHSFEDAVRLSRPREERRMRRALSPLVVVRSEHATRAFRSSRVVRRSGPADRPHPERRWPESSVPRASAPPPSAAR